jgi:hypothetical protein
MSIINSALNSFAALFALKKFHLILHLTSNTGTVTEQCVAVDEQLKMLLEPL